MYTILHKIVKYFVFLHQCAYFLMMLLSSCSISSSTVIVYLCSVFFRLILRFTLGRTSPIVSLAIHPEHIIGTTRDYAGATCQRSPTITPWCCQVLPFTTGEQHQNYAWIRRRSYTINTDILVILAIQHYI